VSPHTNTGGRARPGPIGRPRRIPAVIEAALHQTAAGLRAAHHDSRARLIRGLDLKGVAETGRRADPQPAPRRSSIPRPRWPRPCRPCTPSRSADVAARAASQAATPTSRCSSLDQEPAGARGLASNNQRALPLSNRARHHQGRALAHLPQPLVAPVGRTSSPQVGSPPHHARQPARWDPAEYGIPRIHHKAEAVHGGSGAAAGCGAGLRLVLPRGPIVGRLAAKRARGRNCQIGCRPPWSGDRHE